MGFLYLALRGVEITLYTEAEYGVVQPVIEPEGLSPSPEIEVGAAALPSTSGFNSTQVVPATPYDTM